MPKKNQKLNLRAAAVIASTTLTVWQARTRDVSRAADAGVGFFVKNLVGKEVINRLFAEAKSIRRELDALTLPWTNDGSRLLPAAMWGPFFDLVGASRDRWEVMVDEFIAGYEAHVDDQRRRLGAAFNADEYPAEDEVRSRFEFAVKIRPLPSQDDYAALDIPRRAKTDLQSQVRSEVDINLTRAIDYYRGRISETADKIADQLDGGRYSLRRNSYDYLGELLEHAETFNVTGAPDIAEAADILRTAVVGVDPADLRNTISLKEDAIEACRRAVQILGTETQ